MTYKVGQILYLLSEKSLKVIPVQVVEEIVRNTLKGREITYMVSMPNKQRSVVSLDDVNAKIFTDPDSLEAFMFDNAKKSISHLLNEALSVQEVFVLVDIEEENIVQESKKSTKSTKRGRPKKKLTKNVQSDEEKSKIKVDLGNGIKASVSVEDLDHLGLNT